MNQVKITDLVLNVRLVKISFWNVLQDQLLKEAATSLGLIKTTMNEFTPEQQTQLKTWSQQRDEILGELSVLRSEKDALLKNNTGLCTENGELVNRIEQNKGRIQEIDKQEKARANTILVEIVDLEKRKGILETKVSGLDSDVQGLLERKESLVSTINTLVLMHDRVFDRASVLDQVVDRVTRVNEGNIQSVNEMVVALEKSVGGISGSLSIINNSVFKRANDLNEIVTNALEATAENTKTVQGLVADLKDSLKK